MISGIGRSQNVSLYQNLQRNYQQLSSGKKINSAADNAAGLAIAQKMLSQSNGYDMGTRNAATSQDMVNVADGSLSTITDSLQRIRELGIQASNTAIYGEDDRAAIQQEIDQLKQSISDAGKNTQFNGRNLLDGSMGSSHVASGPDGSGMAGKPKRETHPRRLRDTNNAAASLLRTSRMMNCEKETTQERNRHGKNVRIHPRIQHRSKREPSAHRS